MFGKYFGLSVIVTNFTVFKTNLINYIASVLIVKTKLMFKSTYRAFKIYSFVPLKSAATTGMHILLRPTNHTTYFAGVFKYFPRGTYFMVMSCQCMISLQCLMYVYSFGSNVNFTTKFKGFISKHLLHNFCQIKVCHYY